MERRLSLPMSASSGAYNLRWHTKNHFRLFPLLGHCCNCPSRLHSCLSPTQVFPFRRESGLEQWANGQQQVVRMLAGPEQHGLCTEAVLLRHQFASEGKSLQGLIVTDGQLNAQEAQRALCARLNEPDVTAVPVVAFDILNDTFRRIINFSFPPKAFRSLEQLISLGIIWANGFHRRVIDFTCIRQAHINVSPSSIAAAELYEASAESPDVLSVHSCTFSFNAKCSPIDANGQIVPQDRDDLRGVALAHDPACQWESGPD